MTVNSTTNRVSYTGNGTANPLAVSFPFQAQADLKVIETIIATGAQTTKVLNSDYTITGTPDANGYYSAGGNVVPAALIAITKTWTIYRDPTATQTVLHVDNDPLPAASIDGPLDKLTMIVQRLKDRLDRAMTLPDGDAAVSMVVPTKVDRLGKVAGYDASTGAPTVSDVTLADIAGLSTAADEAEAALSAIQLLGPTNVICSRNYATLAAANAAGILSGKVVFLDSDFTLTAHTALTAKWVGAGGVITTGAFNVTFSNGFSAPDYLQCFATAGAGVITIEKGTHFSVRWTGAVGDNSTNDTAAVTRADAAAVASMLPVFFPSGTYKMTVTRPSGAYVPDWIGPSKGRPNQRTVTLTGWTAGQPIVTVPTSSFSSARPWFEKLAFHGGDGTYIGIYVVDKSFVTVKDCVFQDFYNPSADDGAEPCIHLRNASLTNTDNCEYFTLIDCTFNVYGCAVRLSNAIGAFNKSHAYMHGRGNQFYGGANGCMDLDVGGPDAGGVDAGAGIFRGRWEARTHLSGNSGVSTPRAAHILFRDSSSARDFTVEVCGEQSAGAAPFYRFIGQAGHDIIAMTVLAPHITQGDPTSIYDLDLFDDVTKVFITQIGASGESTMGNTSRVNRIQGITLQPTQPLFSAYLAAPDSDQTGDGTARTVQGYTEIFDQLANFNPTTGVFTAPVGGRYRLGGKVQVRELDSAHTTYSIDLITSNRTYRLFHLNAWNAAVINTTGILSLSFSELCDMDAADTASIVVTVTGGTKTVDIHGAATVVTGFHGELAA